MATRMRSKANEASRVSASIGSKIRVGLIWVEVARFEALKEPVVEANRFASGVSGFPEFEDDTRQGTISSETNLLRVVNRSGSIMNHMILPKRNRLGTSVLTGLRTSMSHGHSAGRGFDSLRLHQIALEGAMRLGLPEQYCGADLDSTEEIDGGKLVPGMNTPYSVYQTIKAKNILAKVAGFLKGLVPSFDLNVAPVFVAA